MKKHAHKNRAECFFSLPSWWRRNENLLEKFCRCFVAKLEKHFFSSSLFQHWKMFAHNFSYLLPPLPKTEDCSHSELLLEQLFFARFFVQEFWDKKNENFARGRFSFLHSPAFNAMFPSERASRRKIWSLKWFLRVLSFCARRREVKTIRGCMQILRIVLEIMQQRLEIIFFLIFM